MTARKGQYLSKERLIPADVPNAGSTNPRHSLRKQSPMKTYTNAQKSKVLAAVAGGLGIKAAAAKYSVSPVTIRKWREMQTSGHFNKALNNARVNKFQGAQPSFDDFQAIQTENTKLKSVVVNLLLSAQIG